MKDLLVPAGNPAQKAEMLLKTEKWRFLLSLLFYPVGIVRIWRVKGWLVAKWLYAIFGCVLFLVTAGYLSIVLFAAFLPPLDNSVGTNLQRTIYNTAGNYSATFLKTGNETNGAYELVQVELEPRGGNEWHYHKTFTEEFTVVEGQVRIGRNGSEIIINKGQSALAQREDMHFFLNARDEKSVLLVKTTPASGLEKTLRVAYGLINDGLLKDDMTKNPWHMALLLGYSETYLQGLPGWFQEPLISALAKIAQWRGEDQELYKYYK
ncbi:cupin domain-containing protein [Chryseolinea soli]|uniref:Cupin domain-containing protein n=1 Tax=Chryseolinea soli TaxID=2321403 RepID=A0A385SHZ0_9BACT|nr:cupin domain-containing protein [Chryseolinea soli]AYB30071.1 cupin domain-containing protein [Chryseolinea soli]